MKIILIMVIAIFFWPFNTKATENKLALTKIEIIIGNDKGITSFEKGSVCEIIEESNTHYKIMIGGNSINIDKRDLEVQ